jgi:hypothetical protein
LNHQQSRLSLVRLLKKRRWNTKKLNLSSNKYKKTVKLNSRITFITKTLKNSCQILRLVRLLFLFPRIKNLVVLKSTLNCLKKTKKLLTWSWKSLKHVKRMNGLKIILLFAAKETICKRCLFGPIWRKKMDFLIISQLIWQ